MFTNNPDSTDPQNYLANSLCRGGQDISGPANNWLGNNVERWCSEEYDALFDELTKTGDPAERARIAIALNDMLHNNYVQLPLVFRGDVSAHSNSLKGVRMNSWDGQLWNIEDWYRE
jgi:peptide/nickel transport system substrate-binding protein